MDKLKMHSPDVTERNLDKVAEMFPTVITESVDASGNCGRAINFDLLRQELSYGVVEGPRERYQLDWPGKREALFAANAPIAKTLRPVREESLDFDTTQNLFIEGDNLDALKLLQESYLGKVKLVYIDPPYNTGNDFVYKDNFSETTDDYLAKSGQVDDSGNRLVANTESNGRFHSDWLSMMYPRLKLVRNLLASDGVICISIDDHESSNLLRLCDEIFGESNRLNTIVWISNLKGRQLTGKGAVGTKEYIVCYARNIDDVDSFRASISLLKSMMPMVYKGFNYKVNKDEHGPFVTKNELYNSNSAFNEITSPTMVFDIYFNPESKEVRTLPVSDEHLHAGFVKISPKRNNNGTNRYHAFRWSPRKIVNESFDLEFVESSNGWKVFTKVRDVDSTALKDLVMGISTNAGSTDITKVGLPKEWFDYPKPVALIQLLCAVATDVDSLVLDFFAGSGTTAHAVLKQNAADGGKRQFIMVQIDEKLDPKSAGAEAGFRTIADLARERIRRAAAKMTDDAGLYSAEGGGEIDVGFRSLKVDTTNLADVRRSPDMITQDELPFQTQSVKPDRTSDDLLFQVLLDWGLELTMSVVVDQVDGHEVLIVEDGALIACFDDVVTPALVSEIAARRPLRAVFRDSGFASDAHRINAEQVFAELSPATDVKAI